MAGMGAGPDIPDVQADLVRVSRSWGWFAFFGVLSVVVGILVLVWPGHTLVALAVLFGLQLVVSGLFRLVAAVAATDATGGTRALMAILGLLGLVVGLWALRHIDTALSVLALFLGIYWIIDGVVEIFSAIDHPELPRAGVGGGLWTARPPRRHRPAGVARADAAGPGGHPGHLSAVLRGPAAHDCLRPASGVARLIGFKPPDEAQRRTRRRREDRW